MNRCVLIQDPCHPYALHFLELLQRKYGLRAICFYTNLRERIRNAPQYPLLSSDMVEAAYDVRPDTLSEFATHLKAHYEIAAVIPFGEPTVLNAVELAQRLNLSWAQPEVMRRFRDKFALKDYLREQHPSLRMTASCRVRVLNDIREDTAMPAFKRFVLKPNGGYGNRSIGLFDSNASDHQLNEYLHAQHGDAVVMEEYVDGIEYFVNGQIDATGNVIVVAIFEYQRIAANQRHNIDYETRRVASTDSRFALLSRYATQVMQATGLKRSPFHMEIKVDERGPCLIEVGARLVGHGNAELCGKMHGDLDLFDLAAHYYLSDRDYGAVLLNWDRYDANEVRYVHGISERSERIYSLQGMTEIEAMPEFVQWADKPQIGATLKRTVDCLSMPWSIVIQAPNTQAADAAAAHLRAILRWNVRVTMHTKLMVNFRALARRYFTAVRVRILAALTPSHDSPFHAIKTSNINRAAFWQINHPENE